MMSLQPYAYYDSGDYEINNHTRGVSVSFTDQLNAARSARSRGAPTRPRPARASTTSRCSSSAMPTATRSRCSSTGTHPSAAPAITSPETAPARLPRPARRTGRRTSATDCCPTFLKLSNPDAQRQRRRSAVRRGPCAYYVVENGAYGLNNTVTPYFSGLLDHRPMAPQRPAFLQPRRARRQLRLCRREHRHRAGAELLVQRLQPRHVLRHADAHAGRPQRARRIREQLEHERSEAMFDVRQAIRQRRTCKTRRAPSITTFLSRASA